MVDKIFYRKIKGYKYLLNEDYLINVGIFGFDIKEEFILLEENGNLTIKKNYAWDGPSGPTIDTKNFIRGSLVHDSLYQLMRQGLLSHFYKERIDRLLQKICIEDGMCKFRTWYIYRAVHRLGIFSCITKIQRIKEIIYSAP